MSGGGGGTKQTVNQVSGLSDAQFNNLQSGQGAIRQDVQSVGNAVSGQIGGLKSDMSAGFSGLGSQINNVNNTVGNLNNTVAGGFSSVGNQINSLGTQVGTQVAGLGQQIDTRTSQLGSQLDATGREINANVNTGFNNLTNTVNSGVGTIVADTRQGFADTRDAINTGVTNLGNTMGARFDAQGNQIATGFTDQANRLDTVQQNVLGGQANLRTLMEQYGGNLDRYYADLAASQADQTQRLGGLQTGLDSFRDDYERDAMLATQQRNRIADGVASGIGAVREDLNATQTALGTQNTQLAQQVSGLQNQQQQQGTMMATNFAQVARDIATGFSDGTAQSIASRNDFISRLNAIRDLASNPAIQVDNVTRQQYTELVSSFDAQGRLIPRSVDQTGMQTARALDSQGSLLVAQFDPNGARVGQQALDVNGLMRQLDTLGYAAPQTQQTGLVSPYYVTR